MLGIAAWTNLGRILTGTVQDGVGGYSKIWAVAWTESGLYITGAGLENIAQVSFCVRLVHALTGFL